MHSGLIDILKRASEAEVERNRLRDLLSRILGDEGPDLDTYMDGHASVPHVPSLYKRIRDLELLLRQNKESGTLRINANPHFNGLSFKEDDRDLNEKAK